jgi:hypothetical protein
MGVQVDRFDIQRQMDNAGEEATTRARYELEAARDSQRLEVARLVKLTVGYYFDPVTKAILKKVGSQYEFVRHDRRKKDRKTQSEAERLHFQLVAGGLFWDEKAKKIYRKSGAHYLLYSPDRRKKASGKLPGPERRKGH